MTSNDYWQRLPPFDYVVTYSFNRGPKLQRLKQAAAELRQATQVELMTARFMRQRLLGQRMEELAQFDQRQDVPLTTAAGSFDITASPVTQFARTDEHTERLRSILTTPVSSNWAAGCRPVFRDALGFHDSAGHIVEVLNICLQCHYLQSESGQLIEADASVYDQLRQLLGALGHPIETHHEQ
ncbi:hypothetical protein [Hymenobacter jeollabukensis]|uniref:Uncharacterized protein n=1 Tax=Hymenobacter jeollabukensis TaxID=2025313 RepID=A0A5R8WQ12_9BACT|nr:hypothetical protein [Hymenobacter jeollabukensis]TLM91822.1 hypothetical protein FDY95_14790 [Hymenobacter jeollabukensis]